MIWQSQYLNVGERQAARLLRRDGGPAPADKRLPGPVQRRGIPGEGDRPRRAFPPLQLRALQGVVAGRSALCARLFRGRPDDRHRNHPASADRGQTAGRQCCDPAREEGRPGGPGSRILAGGVARRVRQAPGWFSTRKSASRSAVTTMLLPCDGKAATSRPTRRTSGEVLPEAGLPLRVRVPLNPSRSRRLDVNRAVALTVKLRQGESSETCTLEGVPGDNDRRMGGWGRMSQVGWTWRSVRHSGVASPHLDHASQA